MSNGTLPEGVSCWNCRHFQTSWDKNFPYLCTELDFKSRMLPCLEVRRADGRDCLAFSPKTGMPGRQK
ncbi:MAG TPA: uracil-DNA glycosylase [Gammaproteobacteria bacterium]|nr:MAG: uracil-DNA glycosylase [OM182 bacterium]HAL42169.1 uracil-DNA glycosylase [Gammaproteobacteria bacterium]HBK18125.1 uracil-DNA glycosylase [Gammaproteobacteria bacterium]